MRFALRLLMMYLHSGFMDLEKEDDRVPRDELWYCMRKSGVAEKDVRTERDSGEVCGRNDRWVPSCLLW